jgi:hypothetical protein
MRVSRSRLMVSSICVAGLLAHEYGIQSKERHRIPDNRMRKCRAGLTRKSRCHWHAEYGGPGYIQRSEIKAERKAERQRKRHARL